MGRSLKFVVEKYTRGKYRLLDYNCQLFTCPILCIFTNSTQLSNREELVKETALNLPEVPDNEIGK